MVRVGTSWLLDREGWEDGKVGLLPSMDVMWGMDAFLSSWRFLSLFLSFLLWLWLWPL